MEMVPPPDHVESTASSEGSQVAEIKSTSTSRVETTMSPSMIQEKPRDRDERVLGLPPPPLSINVGKTLHVDEEEPPIIKQVPDLRTAPSLRGRMFAEGNMHKCQGVWAMNDHSHAVPGQTSDFEFRIAFAGIPPADLPVNGRYSGWFMIKNPQKSSMTKVDDKDLDLKFTKKEESNDYEVVGSGVNKFGRFSVQGTLKSNNMMQLYKIYLPKKSAVPTPRATPRGSMGGSPRPRSTTSLSRQSSALSSSVSSPRESSTRVRRPSLAMSEALAPVEKVQKPIPPQRASSKQALKPVSVSLEEAPQQSRASRAPAFVAKCKDLLKEITKQVSAIYFAEAVDHVRLGIPDYPTIIKEPMDFGTIRSNLERQVYKSHEMFSEHMRLVFKNAVTYNIRRDNPVHIAARELSDLYEEKYRVMVTQLGSNSYMDEVPPPLSRQASVNGGGGGRKSAGGGRGRGRVSSVSVGGPRPMEVAAPPALDGSMQQMMLMHQKMLDMEQELNSLRTAVRQTEIRTSLDQQRVAAQIPLSYDEKKALIENIQRLDGDQITSVVDIIQSAMPSTDCGGDGDEVEIPMDELDTFTLRQLQDYVHSVQQQSINAKRKRQSASKSPRSKKSKASSHPIPQPVEEETIPSIIPPPPDHDFMGLNGSGEGDDEYMGQARKRSNSLDLFPSDEMEQDPIVNNVGTGNGSNLTSWTENVNSSGGASGIGGVGSGGGTWGEAKSERKDSLHRQSELEAEGEKLSELRAQAEADRVTALQKILEEQSAASAQKELNDQNREEAELLAQRELERSKRDGMSRTVAMDESHDALYKESLDL